MKQTKRLFLLLLAVLSVLLTVLPAFADGGTVSADAADTAPAAEQDKNAQFLTVTATDALGRTTTEADSFRTDRYVGLFYFIWFDKSQENALDVTKLYYENPDELFDPRDQTGIAPPGAMYYFNKPLYGYYSSCDEWVIRKHVELFTMAGVDFIAIDMSNDVIYEEAFETLLSVLQCYADAGWNVPKVMCYTNLNSGHTVEMLYDFMYRDGRYSGLWFYGPYDKPLIVADRSEIDSAELADFFEYRPAQWPGHEYEYLEDGWPFCDLNRPQRTHDNLIGVSVAQHNSYIFSYGVRKDPLYPMPRINYGRGYSAELPRNGNVDAILAGANIQEEWDYAIANDPEIIFVTGWNEWATNKRLPEHDDQTVAWFVDSFNTEFSRDIEMTESAGYVYDEATGKYSEEGYGDNYYCQLADNIRRYKGVTGGKASAEKAVRVSMEAYDGEQWEGTYSFLNMSTDNEPRLDFNYYMDEAKNFVRELRVTNDNEKVYFLIRTDADAVLEPENGSLLNILIGVGDADTTGFGGFAYRLTPDAASGKAVLAYTADGYAFAETADAEMTVDGQIVMYAVSRAALGLDGESDFTLRVKCTDSVENPENMLDYYVSGEVLPLGRFACVYRGQGYTAFPAEPVSIPVAGLVIIAAALLLGAGAVAAAVIVRKKRNR